VVLRPSPIDPFAISAFPKCNKVRSKWRIVQFV
jgi:hypothetical protein